MWVLSDNEENLLSLLPNWFVAIDKDKVNLHDLTHTYKCGAVVRCEGDPSKAIKIFTPDNEFLGVVAGWISEEECG